MFDEIIIAVGENSSKTNMFSLEERLKFITRAFKDDSRITVQSYQGLTVDLCDTLNVSVILRGLRNTTDFEFEKSIACVNQAMTNVETVFLLSSPITSHISSSIVREIIKNKGDYQNFVP
jgi:pantetheine-phosphate adenylyltransferase